MRVLITLALPNRNSGLSRFNLHGSVECVLGVKASEGGTSRLLNKAHAFWEPGPGWCGGWRSRGAVQGQLTGWPACQGFRVWVNFKFRVEVLGVISQGLELGFRG